MWIDSHSHIWTPDAERFPLLAGKTAADLNPPSFTDGELLTLARAEGVDRVVLIQHTMYYRFDNSYLLDAIRRKPGAFRAIAMVDDRAPQPGAEMKRLLPLGATGFRITPWIRKDDPANWLNSQGMREMWGTAAETRQAMCCLIDPPNIPDVDAMCSRHPDTRVVIDHFARIGADGQFREADVQALCALARHANVHLKVSGFYGLGQKKLPHLELVPLVRRVFDAFGPRRLMWGSDSPYQLLGDNSYASSIALVRDRLDSLSSADREELLRGTAERVFFTP